ncbi:MAG: hypothetical protein EOO04_37590, partial [Chitinophagaceae bacterium]
MKSSVLALTTVLILFSGCLLRAQTITGAWKGKLGFMKTELKIVKKGDSLLGTSYYYLSKNSYRRYSIKGYFDPETNSVIWWDDELLEEKGGNSIFASHKEPFLSIADFNCPGENKMFLEGKATDKNDKDKQEGPVMMQKVSSSTFRDEWDFVLDNYFVGANHPDIIDSVAGIAFNAPVIPKGFEGTLTPPVPKLAPVPVTKPIVNAPSKSAQEAPVAITAPPNTKTPPVSNPATPANVPAVASNAVPTIEQKFATRNNKLQTVIPVNAEKIELRFYDNAQVDGDSIALFLNGKMIFQNIRLTEQAYTIFLNAKDLQDDNE